MKEHFSFVSDRPKPEYTFGKKARAFARGLMREGPLVEVALESLGHAVDDKDAIAYDNRLSALRDEALARLLHGEIGPEARASLSRKLIGNNFKRISLGMKGLSGGTRAELSGLGEGLSFMESGFLFPSVHISRPRHIERIRAILETLESAGKADRELTEGLISIRAFGGIAERVWREHYYDESYGQGLYESLARK